MIRNTAEGSGASSRLSVVLRGLTWRIYDIAFVTGCDGEAAGLVQDQFFAHSAKKTPKNKCSQQFSANSLNAE